MISSVILIIIVFLAAYIAIKYERWEYMLVSTISAAIIVLIVTGSFANIITFVSGFIESYSIAIFFSIFVLTLTITAALWNRSRDLRIQEEKIRAKRLEYINNIQISGFVDTTHPLENTGWESYMKVLCERLAKNRLSDESFALGIAGEWGSGKTTFLKYMRKELSKSFKVIDFNPWACTDANVVIADFFKTLKSNLPENDKDVLRYLTKYVNLLTDANLFPKDIASITELFVSNSSDSITTLKMEIEKKLLVAKNKYAVIIDDLDRLQQDELFEILRLIRITASFSNIVFIVTYDRHHIHDMLLQNGISEGLQFIKKIFNVEVILPGVEPYTLPNLLKQEIETLMGEDSQITVAIHDAIFETDKFETYELLHYLKNFRDVKRFAMAFAADVSAVEKYMPGEFLFQEFFWLEILRYIDYDTYSTLRVNPSAFLELKNSVLFLKEDVLTKTDIHEETANVLHRIFDKATERSQNSIVYLHNYHNYFSFRIQENKLSQAEFGKLLSLSDMQQMKECVDIVFTQGKIQSLVDLFKNLNPGTLPSKQEQLNYISLLFAIIPYTGSGFISIIRNKLQSYLYSSSSFFAEISNHATFLLKELVAHCIDRKRGYLNMMLAQLHSSSHFNPSYDDGYAFDYSSIISDETLVEGSIKNLNTLFHLRKQPLDITEVTAVDSKLRRFLKNATVVYSTDVSFDPIDEFYKCLPFEALLDYFKAHPSDKLDQFMEPFIFKNDEIEYYEDSDCFNHRRKEICTIFGCLENFAKFTYQCFTNLKDEKEKWIVQYWKIKKKEEDF